MTQIYTLLYKLCVNICYFIQILHYIERKNYKYVMKNILALKLLFLISVQTFGQESDSLKTNKKYKNTIQTNLLGVAGIFELSYERAISKDWSINLIGNYNYIFFNQTAETKFESLIFAGQVKYYLDKNQIYNNGLYVSSTFRFVYRHEYNPPLDNSNAYFKYPGVGTGLGYQTFIKQRIVLNIGGSLFYNFSAKADFPYDNIGWVESTKYNQTIDGSLNLNVGYRF